MSAFVLSISIAIQFVLLIALYYLYKEVQQLKQEKNHSISRVLETYLQEIKAENDRLQSELLSDAGQPTESSGAKVEPSLHSEADFNVFSTKGNGSTYPSALDLDQVEDQAEMSLQAKILQLHEQGISIDDIAKQLDCGKREAELTIKLYRGK